jgi:hypothetical protein
MRGNRHLLGFFTMAAQLPAARPQFLRFQAVPYTLHGKLILKPVDGAIDLSWTGADDPRRAMSSVAGADRSLLVSIADDRRSAPTGAAN